MLNGNVARFAVRDWIYEVQTLIKRVLDERRTAENVLNPCSSAPNPSARFVVL